MSQSEHERTMSTDIAAPANDDADAASENLYSRAFGSVAQYLDIRNDLERARLRHTPRIWGFFQIVMGAAFIITCLALIIAGGIAILFAHQMLTGGGAEQWRSFGGGAGAPGSVLVPVVFITGSFLAFIVCVTVLVKGMAGVLARQTDAPPADADSSPNVAAQMWQQVRNEADE